MFRLFRFVAVRDFPLARLHNEINARFVLNEHGNLDFDNFINSLFCNYFNYFDLVMRASSLLAFRCYFELPTINKDFTSLHFTSHCIIIVYMLSSSIRKNEKMLSEKEKRYT